MMATRAREKGVTAQCGGTAPDLRVRCDPSQGPSRPWQPRRQRDQVHAGRQDRRRQFEQADGDIRAHLGDGLRTGHRRGRAPAHLRQVLAGAPAKTRGRRPRPRDREGDRRGARRRALGGECPGGWGHLPPHAPARGRETFRLTPGERTLEGLGDPAGGRRRRFPWGLREALVARGCPVLDTSDGRRALETSRRRGGRRRSGARRRHPRRTDAGMFRARGS